MRVLVTGSIAFDFIMLYPGRFDEQLRPGSMSGVFAAPSMRRAYGGCAGNIAYGLKKLGNEPVLAAAVGDDFELYRQRLDEFGIDNTNLITAAGEFTACAYIVTDTENNQITIFHPGAMNKAHEQNIAAAAATCDWAIVSPNGKAGMLKHTRILAKEKIPYIFDPGQGLPLFNGNELGKMFAGASCAIFNRDEFSLFCKKTGMSESAAAAKVDTLIVTNGEHGSIIFNGGEKITIDAVVLGLTMDPTGCGDAYRAALLHGLLRQWKWSDIGRFASLIAGIKALSDGGQNYDINLKDALNKFRKLFGKAPSA